MKKKNKEGGILQIISELGKVRISVAVAFTTFTGYILSNGKFDSGFILPFIGIFLLACGASAFNQLQETETDRIMKRTAGRPLPSGRISNKGALGIALAYFISGSLVLYFGPGLLTLLVGISTFIWYNLIYTPLKKITAFAAVPGSMVGALPPLAGWVAGGGSLTDPRALAIGFFFFMGQIPHFWLLLLKLGKQYEGAGLPSLTQILTDEQIKRLTFVWIASTAVSALALPVFRLQDNIWSISLIMLLSAILVIIFIPLLNRKKPFNVGKSFVLINVYYLFIMFVMIADRLV
ncbi:MAG: protoheme IX farnesyltransferase [Bacteroidales bacterium]